VRLELVDGGDGGTGEAEQRGEAEQQCQHDLGRQTKTAAAGELVSRVGSRLPDAVIQVSARKADEEAIPLLYGRRGQRGEREAGRRRR